MERRNSSSSNNNKNDDDHQTPRQRANPNVFDDEYALDHDHDHDHDDDDFMPGVSDGFRPMNTSAAWDSDRQHGHDGSDSPRPLFTATKSTENDLRRVATRNSTAKVPCARESMSHDGRLPNIHTRGLSSQATALHHRDSVSSTASFATMAASEGPFGAGPSHPYGMYPQNTMARNSSITTSTTQRHQEPSEALQRPAHPYGMYPQTTMEDEPPMPPVQSAIPVGFPGIPAGFHRQIGPDGEEQDIIGPDGHTEQLPPYSRYPEEGPTKAALAAEANLTPAETPTTPLNASNEALIPLISAVSPVSPLAPIFPAHLPPSRPETQNRDMPPMTAVPPVVAPALQATEPFYSEKQEMAKGDKNWRSKKLWGRVPMGVALVLLILVLVFAIILGAAIGTFVAKNKDKPREHKEDKHKENPAAQVTMPSPSLFDATPFTASTTLAPLPTGDYALPLGVAQESSPNCLSQANQLSAWSCKMTFAPLILTIDNTPADNVPAAVSIQAFPKPDGGIQYGVQPPILNASQTQLVSDLDLKAYGPAYHFSALYDKIVVLSSDEFTAGASLRKRDQGGDNPPFRHRFQVLPGDNPWYCFWNGTYIEGYIYVNDDSTAAGLTGFPTASAFNNPSGSSIPVETSAPTTITEASPSNPTESAPSPTSLKRRGDGDYPPPPPYPRIVKMEERRLPGSKQPYCQKMLLLDDGQITSAPSDNGTPITVFLQEEDPSLDDFLAAGAQPASPSASSTNATERRREALQKRTDPANACHCQWMFQ